jgi:sec-independent protein translocase protein TatA
MANIGFSELIVILLLLTLVFGGSRLPALGESIGKAIRGFKRGMAEDDRIEVAKVERAKLGESSSEPSKASDSITDAEVLDETKR